MGAEIEARDYRGRTPLLLAAELGNDNNLNNPSYFFGQCYLPSSLLVTPPK